MMGGYFGKQPSNTPTTQGFYFIHTTWENFDILNVGVHVVTISLGFCLFFLHMF